MEQSRKELDQGGTKRQQGRGQSHTWKMKLPKKQSPMVCRKKKVRDLMGAQPSAFVQAGVNGPVDRSALTPASILSKIQDVRRNVVQGPPSNVCTAGLFAAAIQHGIIVQELPTDITAA